MPWPAVAVPSCRMELRLLARKKAFFAGGSAAMASVVAALVLNCKQASQSRRSFDRRRRDIEGKNSSLQTTGRLGAAHGFAEGLEEILVANAA